MRFIRIFILIFLVISLSNVLARAQMRLKLGAEQTTIESDAVLDLGTGNRGLLLPRVSMGSLISPSPLSRHIEGMIVYNIQAGNGITPGLYYNNGLSWIKLEANGQPVNLYSSDGALSTSRTVSLGVHDLTFEGTGRVRITGSTGSTSFSMGPTGAFGIDASGLPSGRLAILENGHVGIGTATPQFKLDVVGDIRTNSVVLNSDSLLKRQIQPLTSEVSNLLQLSGYQYYWKNPKTSNQLQYGFIAQEVEKYFPHLVTFDGKSKSVHYMQVIPLLLEALKRQESRISSLEAELKQIQEAIQTLKK